jgi:hypothetical protein
MDEAPIETLRGTLTDSHTGKNFQTEDARFQFVLKEISYSDNAPERTYQGMFEGTYQNTKLFNAEYSLELRGAFLPVPIENVKVSGTVVKDFTVTPLTNFNGVSASMSGNDIIVNYTVSRTTTEGGDITDVRVLAGRYERLGHATFEYGLENWNRSFDTDTMLGVEQSVTITHENIDPSVKYYARVATRTKNAGGFWNYSEVVEVN